MTVEAKAESPRQPLPFPVRGFSGDSGIDHETKIKPRQKNHA
jgi:hypothetical protein